MLCFTYFFGPTLLMVKLNYQQLHGEKVETELRDTYF